MRSAGEKHKTENRASRIKRELKEIPGKLRGEGRRDYLRIAVEWIIAKLKANSAWGVLTFALAEATTKMMIDDSSGNATPISALEFKSGRGRVLPQRDRFRKKLMQLSSLKARFLELKQNARTPRGARCILYLIYSRSCAIWEFSTFVRFCATKFHFCPRNMDGVSTWSALKKLGEIRIHFHEFFTSRSLP